MQTDILIVGGGLSGLALADHLTDSGRDFLLVEAQDRLGGRILTRDVDSGTFDLGPAWFWPGQPRMAALTERFNIPVFEQFSSGDLMYQDQSGAVQRGRGYASMQGSLRLAGGMGRMIDALAGGLDPRRVLTKSRLEKIEYSPDGITTHFNQDGESLVITAGRIVLAMPPRVIADSVTFVPALDAAQMQALRNIPTWMAGQAKIVAIYDKPHWRDAGLSGDAMSQRGPMVEIHDASPMTGAPYAVFGFVGVPADIRIAHRTELLSEAVQQLTALFGPEMAQPRALILQDWATNPDIARPADRNPVRTHPTYGLPADLKRLVEQGIHFGSTETARDYGGFLEGALEAAEATAKSCIQHLNGQTCSS